MTSGIYVLTQRDSGKQYIGQSWNIEARWNQHNSTKYQQEKRCAIVAAIRKYGWDSFDREVLAEAGTQEELDRLEVELIQQYGTLAPGGYNLTSGGKGGRPSPEAVEKSRQTRLARGFKHSEESKQKMSKSQTGKPRRGTPRTEAEKASLSAKTLAYVESIGGRRPHTEETKRKISQALTGKKLSPETIARQTAAKVGKKPTAEIKAKRLEASQLQRLLNKQNDYILHEMGGFY